MSHSFEKSDVEEDDRGALKGETNYSDHIIYRESEKEGDRQTERERERKKVYG
jgi:hypothetical protein